MLNNILLTTACATVFVGTLYPLVLESLTGAKISVGPPYFNLTFGPLMVPLLLAMPFGPFLAWKRGDLLRRGAAADVRGDAGRRRRGAGAAAFSSRAVAGAVRHRARRVVIAGAVSELGLRASRLGSVPLARAWRRARNLPRSAYRHDAGALRHWHAGASASSPPPPIARSASSS